CAPRQPPCAMRVKNRRRCAPRHMNLRDAQKSEATCVES
ncbi:hypothetical protein A2U01_0070878, partial [Trifolium medium]|nr:hypothetical protein [Trifolium medium]